MTAALLPETLYRDYREKVDRYVKSRVADRQDAEDLVEDVFVKACARLGQYDPDRAAPGTWLYAIARNAVVDYFRARGTRGEHCGEEALERYLEDGALDGGEFAHVYFIDWDHVRARHRQLNVTVLSLIHI